MGDRIPTSYADLLKRILARRLLEPEAEEEVAAALRAEDADAPAILAHEVLRHLVRRGRLALEEGRLEPPGSRIVAADLRHGLRYALPDLLSRAYPALPLPRHTALQVPTAFSSEEIAAILAHERETNLATIEQSADLKTVILGILDLARRLLEIPGGIFFSNDLPVPSGIARGPRELILSPQRAPRDRSELPRAWAPWIATAGRDRSRLLCLPDLRLLPPPRRPGPCGAALLASVEGDHPAWSACLVLLAQRPHWFTAERIARLRLLLPYFRSQLVYASQLRSVVSYDFLTEIYNRAFFIDHLARTLDGARRKAQRFGLLIIDIDDFRSFNSRYGYDAGDAVLKSVATTLDGVLRSTDVLARYGGEEFVAVLAPELTAAEAVAIGERLRQAVEQLRLSMPHLSGEPRQETATVSIGGALFPDDGDTRDALFQAANRRLLAAKAGGKNAVLFRSPDEPAA